MQLRCLRKLLWWIDDGPFGYGMIYITDCWLGSVCGLCGMFDHDLDKLVPNTGLDTLSFPLHTAWRSCSYAVNP